MTIFLSVYVQIYDKQYIFMSINFFLRIISEPYNIGLHTLYFNFKYKFRLSNNKNQTHGYFIMVRLKQYYTSENKTSKCSLKFKHVTLNRYAYKRNLKMYSRRDELIS